uniref:Uncharacterized protein n=1 Tax=Siphoviridae sp. ctOIB27 TaxID=2826308 RepID=A0A8S5LU10_9CAUD|nr:MAG TPA: hypothetical protein [Siphoviridae sp. ctOIB27]
MLTSDLCIREALSVPLACAPVCRQFCHRRFKQRAVLAIILYDQLYHVFFASFCSCSRRYCSAVQRANASITGSPFSSPGCLNSKVSPGRNLPSGPRFPKTAIIISRLRYREHMAPDRKLVHELIVCVLRCGLCGVVRNDYVVFNQRPAIFAVISVAGRNIPELADLSAHNVDKNSSALYVDEVSVIEGAAAHIVRVVDVIHSRFSFLFFMYAPSGALVTGDRQAAFGGGILKDPPCNAAGRLPVGFLLLRRQAAQIVVRNQRCAVFQVVFRHDMRFFLRNGIIMLRHDFSLLPALAFPELEILHRIKVPIPASSQCRPSAPSALRDPRLWFPASGFARPAVPAALRVSAAGRRRVPSDGLLRLLLRRVQHGRHALHEDQHFFARLRRQLVHFSGNLLRLPFLFFRHFAHLALIFLPSRSPP